MGKILVNLQSLEFALRARLSYDDSSHAQLPKGKMLQDLKTGDKVPENSLTNYETLKQLIARYNKRIANSNPDLKVDSDLATLRDALAHGRASSLQEDSDIVLLKFSHPKDGQVTVTFSECLIREWLSMQGRRLYTELLKVTESMDRARARLRNQQPQS